MTVEGGRIVVRVEGRDVGLSDLLSRINSQMNASGSSSRNYVTAMNQISPITQRTDQALARYAQSLASVAQRSGDTVGAQRILAQALQQITPATASANQVQNQLQGYLNQSAAAASKTSFSLMGVAQGLFFLRGAYATIAGVAKTFVADTIEAGNALEKQLVTFRVLSGSSEAYESNLAQVRSQQAAFGGSLKDTVEDMSGFVVLSRNTGVELSKLANLARAMSIIDPAQGFKGASIALKEFFSGDITSLARRFEIPRGILNDIKNIADEGERFAALEQALAQFGITTDLLAAQANSTATAYAKLSGSADDAFAALGRGLAQILRPAAEGLTVVLNEVANGIGSLVDSGAQLDAFGQRIFDITQAGGLEAFNAKIRETNAAIAESDPVFGALFAKLQELTPAQYAYAQALADTGLSFTEIMDRINASSELFGNLEAVLARIQRETGATDAQMLSLGSTLAETASISAAAQGFIEGLILAMAQGLPVEQAMIALEQYRAAALLEAANAQAIAAEQTSIGATAVNLLTQELSANALEAINTSIQTDILKVQQENLYNAALAAAQGMVVTADSAAQLGAQFNLAAGEAYNLINAIRQLAVAQAKAGDSGLNPRDFDTNAQYLQAVKDAEAMDKAWAAQKEYNFQVADTAGKLNIARGELAKTTQGTEAYWQALSKVNSLETQYNNELNKPKKGGGAGGGGISAPRLTPNEKINTALLDQQDKFNAKYEDEEQKHYDNLIEIQEDYNQKVAEKMRENEVSKRRGRYDFYTELGNASEDGVDVSAFAQQYEDAFAEAQRIAQEGKAALSNEFLELRQKQIQEMLQLEQEAAQIRASEAEGEISSNEAADQLAFLEGRKKLLEEAQAEERKLLLEGGDQYQNELNEKLTAEEQRYAEQTAKISTEAERAANAKIVHAQRSKIAVDDENVSLAQQADLYDRIAATNGGVVPSSQRTLPQSAATPTGEQATVDVTATTPLPVSTTDALLVRQAEMFLVHDQDVINTLADVGTRLENRLLEVITAVNSANTNISGAVRAVEGAVGRIRNASSPNLVQG